MTSLIRVSKNWWDDDIIQLRLEVCDGASTYVNSAYVAPNWAADVAEALEVFAGQIHGGLYDMDAGMSGPEYADGFFSARFHWFKPTQLFVGTRQQSEYFEFKGHQVVSECTLFLRTEPALLDRFITELRAVHWR